MQRQFVGDTRRRHQHTDRDARLRRHGCQQQPLSGFWRILQTWGSLLRVFLFVCCCYARLCWGVFGVLFCENETPPGRFDFVFRASPQRSFCPSVGGSFVFRFFLSKTIKSHHKSQANKSKQFLVAFTG